MSAILFCAIFLNESMTGVETIGMVLILGSAFLSEIQKKS
jgi:drug/metabolite transporter (DMT)-like permease